MTQKETIKLLREENKLLKEQIELKKELIYDEDLSEPKLEEPKLKVGKWYKLRDNKLLSCWQGESNSPYGFGFSGTWHNTLGSSSKKEYIPATDKEVKSALISEAKKRGFNYCNWRFINGILHATNGCISAGWCRYDTVFKNGEWIKIETKPTIAGYEMEVLENYVKFGCKEYLKKDVEELYYACGELEITSVEIEGADVSMEQLKEIVEYLNK